MKVCFDTCVIVDLLGRTGECFTAYVALDVCFVKNYEPCCSASSTTDIAYLMHSRGFAKTEAEAKKSIDNVLNLFNIISNNESDVMAANSSNMKDYEDALMAFSSKRANVDVIVTRNKKDFKNSPIPALTPVEFAATFKPSDYVYEEACL